MARKKEGYDWVTNTYYIPVESGGCGCFVVLGIIIWVLIKFDEWYEDHTGLFWGLIIALVALIIFIISMRSSSKTKHEEEAAQEARRQRDEAQKARRMLWCTEGLEALRRYSQAYGVNPLLRRNTVSTGPIADLVAPKDVVQLLVYLDFPFKEPTCFNGRLSLTINSQEVLSIASGADFTKPLLFKVESGDHVELRCVNGDASGIAHLGDLQLAWCLESSNPDALFNIIAYDVDDRETMIKLQSAMYMAYRFVVDFSSIDKVRTGFGWKGPSRKSMLFYAKVPEGCSRLYMMPSLDGSAYNLRDSGISLAIINDGKVLDIIDDDGFSPNRRLYPLTPGTSLSINVCYDMRKELKVSYMRFFVLKDDLPEDEAKALASYLTDYYANEDRKQKIEEYEEKIADKQKEIDKDFVTKREKDDGRKLIDMWQEEAGKLKAQLKDVNVDDYIKINTQPLVIENSLPAIASTIIED